MSSRSGHQEMSNEWMDKDKGWEMGGGVAWRGSESTNSVYKIIWGDIMDSMVTIASNIALYIWKSVRDLKNSQVIPKILTMWVDECVN